MDLSKLLSGLGMDAKGGQNDDLLRQAENMWKMLDDLAENNPDGYKSFVSSNIEQGKQVIKEEKEAETKEFTKKLDKNSFKATLRINFLLKPKIDTSELKTPSSIVIDKNMKSLQEYKGSILLSIFSVKEQKRDLQPSLDHMNFAYERSEICSSVCAAFCPASADGLLAAPMSQAARKDLSLTMNALQGILPFEAKKSFSQRKIGPENFEPKLFSCQLIPESVGRLKGYLDCEGKTSHPSAMLLETLLAEHRLAALKKEEAKQETKPVSKPEVIFKPQSKEEVNEPKAEPLKTKPAPKIQVLAEETNFEAMILEKKANEETVEMSIEVDVIESLQEVDLDISKHEVRLVRRSPSW